jgi:hypothetical protein
MLENTQQVLNNILEGIGFGYSDCCIIYHSLRQVNGDMFEEPDVRPLWQGSGYICCPQCTATKNHFQVHVEIAGRRLYSGFFPQHSDQDSDDIGEALQMQKKRINYLYHTMVPLLREYKDIQ